MYATMLSLNCRKKKWILPRIKKGSVRFWLIVDKSRKMISTKTLNLDHTIWDLVTTGYGRYQGTFFKYSFWCLELKSFSKHVNHFNLITNRVKRPSNCSIYSWFASAPKCQKYFTSPAVHCDFSFYFNE